MTVCVQSYSQTRNKNDRLQDKRQWLDDVGCTGSELTLDACGNFGLGHQGCVHSKDAGVNCTNCRYYCQFRFFMYIKHVNMIQRQLKDKGINIVIVCVLYYIHARHKNVQNVLNA